MIFGWGDAPANEPRTEHLLMAGSGLSDAEIQRIREVGDSFVTMPVRVWPDGEQRRVNATGAHFVLNDETRWVYERMAERARAINDLRFSYELTGFSENFYYLSYGPGEHFDWHLDQGLHTRAPRKLSLSLQLSDDSEYEGGDLEVMVPAQPMVSERGKGLIAAFPSHKIHRVTPVTRGKRRALVMFVHGPSFR